MATQVVNLIKGDSIKGVEYRDSLPVNMFAVKKETLNASGFMRQWYGLESYSTGFGVDRGAIWVSRTGLIGHYRVSGNKLIKITGGTVEELGDIPGDGQASLAYSFNNLAIVADKKLFYYNEDDGLRQITDEDIGEPIDIVFIDGYFVLTDGEDVFHSSLSDEEAFEPLDFTNPQFRPDPSRGLAVSESNELIVFGKYTTESYSNTANENFAFTRISGRTQKIGIIGTDAKKELGGLWYTLSRRKEGSPSLHIISLGGEQKISTREIDKIISEYTDEQLELTTIDTMVIDSSKFVQFNFVDHTLLFNASIAESFGLDVAWTILKSDVIAETPFRGVGAIYDPTISKWIVGDRFNSAIGLLSDEEVTHYGEIAEWILTTPFIKAEGMSIDEIEIETMPGLAPDNDAKVSMSITLDGRTYGKEYWELYGENLQYNQRFFLRRVGYVRNWIGFKLRGASRSRMSFGAFILRAS